jgi:hypothetical protein
MGITKKTVKTPSCGTFSLRETLMYRFPSSACKQAYAGAVNRSIVLLHSTVPQLSKNTASLKKVAACKVT